jgi:hypothetical protein
VGWALLSAFAIAVGAVTALFGNRVLDWLAEPPA